MKQQLLHWNKAEEKEKKNPKIVLLGNPNSGKSSLFNHLTGLNQKIGNFPGVTVDKKSGFSRLNRDQVAEYIDLPGCYSIYPRSLDERVVFDLLSNPHGRDFPDLAIVVVDASNLKRNLLLFSQVKDLGIPIVLALNMLDLANKAKLKIDHQKLAEELGVEVVPINARMGAGLHTLKQSISNSFKKEHTHFYDVHPLASKVIDGIKQKFRIKSNYRAYQLAHQFQFNTSLTPDDKEFINDLKRKENFNDDLLQAEETIARYSLINKVLNQVILSPDEEKLSVTEKIDRIVTHRIWGYTIFLGILFLIFQAIFAWATVPMDFIDYTFSELSTYLKIHLPAGPVSELITEGVIPGVGGILIFIPQIALLFAFISILEETGYMSRVVFLMDKIMRKFGLSGKSVVPLISGVACAIPAIMATRSIDNWKDRMITIFVTPFMSCSARLPVYTILIALVIPETTVFGFFNVQGLVLLGMYLLGFITALLSAMAMKFLIGAKDRSYLIMELPSFKMPRWNNVGLTIVEKVKTFVIEAGQIILAISVVLWVLASYGPKDEMQQAEKVVTERLQGTEYTAEEFENQVEAYELQHSYAGHFGKFIEPVIEPLGYDWKIGIALITSFAAREVFVGTMATIYSIGSDADDDNTIKNRLRQEINPDTGERRFNAAVGLSLLVFYAFAMQCMSTLAIVRRETKSWKWPVYQLIYMTGLAYLSALVVYQLMK